MRKAIPRTALLLAVFSVMLSVCFCAAEEDWLKYWEDPRGPWEWHKVSPGQLYDAKKTDFHGKILWTTVDPQIDLRLRRSISLSNGKLRQFDIEDEYIIQKDPNEYDGVLYAIEDGDQVAVWLMQPDGEKQRLAEYTLSYPYWYIGPQTVRAYMHGTLYYIRSSERIAPDKRNWHHDAVLCSIDAQGNEYVYRLTNEDKPVGAVFHYFAISPNGRVAWMNADDPAKCRHMAREILVETPGEGVKQVLPEGFEADKNWDPEQPNYVLFSLEGQCLGWMDDDRLLFGCWENIPNKRNCGFYLYCLQPDTGTCGPMLNAKGDRIKLYHSIQGASGVVYIPQENLIAYMGQTNAVKNWDMRSYQVAVPHIVDLDTGRNYVLYENRQKDVDEDRLGRWIGQLTWVNTK